MLFSYKATNKAGKTISGTAEAANRQALASTLHRQGLKPMLITTDSSHTKISGGLFGPKKKVKLNELVIFTRQLSTMISAGVPLARGLAALQNDTSNPYMRQVLIQITKDVESGIPLADALAKHPTVFSDVYVNMVRAGEAGGILDDILKRLATQVEQEASMRKKIKSAMMYPIVILSVTVVAFFIIMLFIVPKLAVILKSLGGANANLPIYTEILLKFSQFCTAPTIAGVLPIPIINRIPNLIILAVIGALIGFWLLRYTRTPKGKYQLHAILLKTPIVKKVIIKIAVARFSRTFASLMSAGVSVLDALEVTGAAIGNKVIEAELKSAAKEVRNGQPLSDPISQSKYFPPIVAQMLLVGEETGEIDTVLIKIADFYEEEVTVLIDGLAAIIEPIMILVLGIGVGLIAASVMGPIANLSKGAG